MPERYSPGLACNGVSRPKANGVKCRGGDVAIQASLSGPKGPSSRALRASVGLKSSGDESLWVKSPLCRADRGRSMSSPSLSLSAASASFPRPSLFSGVMSAAGSRAVAESSEEGGLGLREPGRGWLLRG